MNVRIRLLGGASSGQSIQILPGTFLIGRATDCDLCLQSDFVSAHHCVLLLDDYALGIRDLGSKNGTFVNGRPVSRKVVILTHGDTITLGDLFALVDFERSIDTALPDKPTAASSACSMPSGGAVPSDESAERADSSCSTLSLPLMRPAVPAPLASHILPSSSNEKSDEGTSL